LEIIHLINKENISEVTGGKERNRNITFKLNDTQKEIYHNYEIFFLFDQDAEEDGEKEHMFYSVCDNPNFFPQLDKCPMVTMNSTKYDIFTGYFGPRWVELFKIWFTEHTGLLVVHVERQNW
jgi:hypothetical protein